MSPWDGKENVPVSVRPGGDAPAVRYRGARAGGLSAKRNDRAAADHPLGEHVQDNGRHLAEGRRGVAGPGEVHAGVHAVGAQRHHLRLQDESRGGEQRGGAAEMAGSGESHSPQQHHPHPGTLEHRPHRLRGISPSFPCEDLRQDVEGGFAPL